MRPTQTLNRLVRAGITHVIGIPDNTSGPLFLEVRRHPTLRLVTVAREGEAFAIASGLWLGGAKPFVVIQNTGLLESGDALRGTALRMAVPVPVLITGRGYAKMDAAGLGPEESLTTQLLTRPDVDSTALFTEATLDAWGVPFAVCRPDDDPMKGLDALIERAEKEERPCALVMARSLV